MSKMIWIVVADSTRARVFNTDNPGGSLVERENLLHQASRNKTIDLVSDRPGRESNSDRMGSHTLGHEKDIKEQEALSFAREISEKLDKAYHQQQIRRLYLMASPHMLGLLRKQISQEVRAVTAQETDINLVKEDPAIIRSHLPKNL